MRRCRGFTYLAALFILAFMAVEVVVGNPVPGTNLFGGRATEERLPGIEQGELLPRTKRVQFVREVGGQHAEIRALIGHKRNTDSPDNAQARISRKDRP